MRRFKNLKKAEQQKLSIEFPELVQLAWHHPVDGYKKVAVSVFDHWLGKDGMNLLLSNVQKEEQDRRNSLHYKLSSRLIEETNAFTFRINGGRRKPRPVFKEFTSKQAALNYVIPSFPFFYLVLPELKAIYVESWDDTNVLFYRDSKLLEGFKDWVSEAGLYLIQYET